MITKIRISGMNEVIMPADAAAAEQAAKGIALRECGRNEHRSSRGGIKARRPRMKGRFCAQNRRGL